ncbi:MAG TPA: thioesterase family protein [Acidimicrobiia bacterium]|nr:thioesterase family protein [Acidimicrobiia bacterium]
MTAFERATSVSVGGDGRFAASVNGEWDAPRVPQGGIVTALALRAMLASLDDRSLPLRTVTAMFAEPVQSGDIEIDAAVFRRGRSTAHCSANVRNPGSDAGCSALAMFGADRPTFTFTDLEPPSAPPPDDCVDVRNEPAPDEFPMSPFWAHHVQFRPITGQAPWVEYDSTSSETMYWFRYDDPPCDEHGRLDPLALVALCDTMPGAIGQRLGNRGPMFWAPSVDLTVHVLGDPGGDWLLARGHARHVDRGYASLENQLWDGDRLVAYATQVAALVFPDGPPTDEERVPRDLLGG